MPMEKTDNMWIFKNHLGKQLEGIEDLHCSKEIKKQTKSALFREIVANPEYQKMRKEYLNEKKSENFSEIKSKEKVKIPQLESKNYKIDEWKSKQEKLVEWWKEYEISVKSERIDTKIKILKKEFAPGAYVMEYQDDGKTPDYLVGQQLFSRGAVVYFNIQHRLPTVDQYKALWVDGWPSPFLSKNTENRIRNKYRQRGKLITSGYGEYNSETIKNIHKSANYWLADCCRIHIQHGCVRLGGDWSRWTYLALSVRLIEE